MRRFFPAIRPLLAAAACGIPVPALAQDQPPIQRPEASRRVVARFDFDRPEPYDLPRHWDLDFGDGQNAGDDLSGSRRFPTWNSGALDHTVAHQGEGSVRLSTSGGSVRLRLDAGAVPVFAETEYLISAAIRTRGLHHARAALSARYLDKESRPIRGSEVRSKLIISHDTEWHKVRFALPGDIAEAAYIQIDLDVLQPEEYELLNLGVHQVWPQDFSGDVWFDDVAIVQLPRLRLSTSSPTNIIEQPQRPELSIQVRDLSGQTLTANLIVQDAAGRIIDTQSEALRGGSASWRWTPRVERLGWYRAILDLTVGGQRVGATFLDFAWLPERQSTPPGAIDAAALNIHVPSLPLWQAEHLPTLVRASSAGMVTIPVWTADLTPESLDSAAQDLAAAIASLQIGGTQIAFSFPRLPDRLAAAAHLDTFNPGAIFDLDESQWLPLLLPLLDRFGQTVRRWQIGEPGRAAYGHPEAADRLRSVLARLVPGPVVAASHAGELGPTNSGVDDLFISVPWTIPPHALAEFASMWAADQPIHSFLIEPLPADQFTREDRASDLLKKAVMLWAALPPDTQRRNIDGYLSCEQPWNWASSPGDASSSQEGSGGHSPMPRVELPVWRTVAAHLAGRRIVGSFPGGDGIFCLILAPRSAGGTGALVAWQDGPVRTPVLEAYLGAGELTAVDMFGNRRSIPVSSGPVHRIPISAHPVFIEGVDVDLARFIASFYIKPGIVNPQHNEHSATLHLSNPWLTHAQGRITIVEPGPASRTTGPADRSWHILPRILEFSIAPGQAAQLPMRLAFSGMEEHGPKKIVAEIELVGQRHPLLRVQSPLEIHLDGLELDLSYRVINTNGQIDVVVEAIVTNRSALPSTLELAAFAIGHPRARASITDLAPGATAMRRFAFPKAQSMIGSGLVAITVYNAETGARINRSLRIE